MFDIHYHLLFGLDDGPKTIEESIALAEASIAEGVTHIVATPHSDNKYEFKPALIRERKAELERILNGRLTIGLGCDLHLSYENLQQAFADPSRFSINGGRYVLVELSDTTIPTRMGEIFFNLHQAHLIPILTHPERNPILMAHPERLMEWVRDGCLVQVTAGSLTGSFGKMAERAAFQWIENGWVHFLASDAHHIEWRRPSMGRAYAAVDSKFGKETADRLCVKNPRAAFFNEDLGPQPEPSIYEKQSAQKPGLLSRIFGRS